MRKHANLILSLLMMALFSWALLQINLASPRVDVSALSSAELPPDRLVLLEGGALAATEQGQECYRITIHWEGGGCLFVPKAGNHRLWVNGVEWDDLKDGKQRLFQFSDAPSPSHTYEVEIRSAGRHLSQYAQCIYLGPLSAVKRCITSQLISRYLITGICLSVLVFSLMLYAWKRSEAYLFWLALYALLMMLRTQDALGLGFFLSRENAFFQALDSFVTSSLMFRFFYQLLSTWLQYNVLRHYMNVTLWGRPILAYIWAAGLIRATEFFWPGGAFFLGVLYNGVLYTCHIVCIQKDPALPPLERHILSVAWVFTVVLQGFALMSSYSKLPYGDASLLFHMSPVITCIYVAAFFAIACRRFAIKFQEADDLNTHLEAAIEEKTKEQTLFIRSMLHNLKTPLFSLTGYADMARESLEQPGGQTRRYLDKIDEKTQYVNSLLDRIFFLTQMDANQVVFQALPVCLTTLLGAVVESTQLKGKEKDIRVAFAGAQDAFCMGDPLYLQQAFQNIADNAVEHMGPAGTLAIALRAEGDAWEIRFADDGRGIPAEDLPRIFDRYYSNHHGKRNSSGLGLTIAKEIVERHSGSISAESPPGQGAVFTIRLPRISPEGL